MVKIHKLKDNFKSSWYIILGGIFIVYSLVAFFTFLRGRLEDSNFIFVIELVEMMLIVLGIVFIRANFKLKSEYKWLNIFIGGILVLLGVVPILVSLKLLFFLPVNIALEPSYLLLVLVLFFASIYFVVDQYLKISRD
ncbi:MAG: hypothetical protein Q8Q35_04685 [Nanoarchaeota archaeon]|nr:hypothetical protein [Nanoarchaeota archaeon]